MKKILAAAALAVLSLTATVPTHAATPTAAPAPAAPVPGVYVIHNVASEPGSGLGIGPVPLIYPPIDVPLRYFGGQLVERWTVKEVAPDRYTISAGPAQFGHYAFVPREDAVFLSATKKPGEWTIEPAGNRRFTIGLPGADRIATLDRDDVPQVKLDGRSGSPTQLWEFDRVDIDD
ncbi:RICIN domain-containing protein [Streptomyces sp. NPDC092952]|uniref:RICIN domain-containing protein n=1 Tax=Streptomyces sp. NPDC092952 TaxID=3366018 RepID=UPI0038075D74